MLFSSKNLNFNKGQGHQKKGGSRVTRYKIAPVLFRIFLLIGGVLLLNFRQAAAVSDVAGIQLCNRLLFTEDSGFWSRFIWYRPIEITTAKRTKIQSKFNIIHPVQKASKRGLTTPAGSS